MKFVDTGNLELTIQIVIKITEKVIKVSPEGKTNKNKEKLRSRSSIATIY